MDNIEKYKFNSIERYNKARIEIDLAEKCLMNSFIGYKKLIKNNNFENAKEYLRKMPECPEKIFAFKEILYFEDKYKKE